MKKKKLLLGLAMIFSTILAHAQLEYIHNITVAQRADASGLVDVNFDLVAQPGSYNIFVLFAENDTTWHPISIYYLSGDVEAIAPGTDYHIIWDGLGSNPHTYGPQSQLKLIASSDCPHTVTDIDGNVYENIPIGEQCWMRENLKTTTYADGTAIPNVTDGFEWEALSIGAHCCYDNIILAKDRYGLLYNWYAVDTILGLCPEGWHVPTNTEWTIMTDYLDGEDFAGGKMKSTRTEPDFQPRWLIPNTGASNSSGFTGFPGGVRGYFGFFEDIERNGLWWSSAENTFDIAFGRSMNYNYNNVFIYSFQKPFGMSVRCLRD